MNLDNIRKIIKIAMYIKDITQNELASKTGITQPSINSYLKRNSQLRTIHLWKVIVALGLDINFVFSLAKEKYNKFEYAKQIIKEYEK